MIMSVTMKGLEDSVLFPSLSKSFPWSFHFHVVMEQAIFGDVWYSML